MPEERLLWVVFGVVVLVVMALDLGVFHRRNRKIHFKEALIWSIVWISLALGFFLLIYLRLGHDSAIQFITGYLVEKMLSVDNLFVFLLIFGYFAVPESYQHKVLFWGILGALVMRGLFIAFGLAILDRFEWVVYLFGAFLIYTGIRLSTQKEMKFRPESNPVFKLFCRFVPMTNDYHEGGFFARLNGQRVATMMLLVLLVVETTDIVFAVDSIPAVLAISTDPFIVYTSNIFAILGLRALYFVLAHATARLVYLRFGLSIILGFLGIKMVSSHFIEVPALASLGVVGGILAAVTAASLLWGKREVTSSN